MSDLTCRQTMRAAFDQQIVWCAEAPFTAQLLGILRDDLDAGGLTASLLVDWPGDPVRDAVPLRLAGAFHFLVRSGAAPALARLYPPYTDADADTFRSEVLAVAEWHRHVLETFIASPPQTNEVGRSAILLGGFLRAAEQTALPLRLLEIGASAGLNLAWDNYGYDIDGAPWGRPDAAVRLKPRWSGPRPPLHVQPLIASRAACDRAPIDIQRESGRLRLLAYIWPEQGERLARTTSAIEACLQAGIRVEQATAAAWLEKELADASPGVATVVYHSVFWQYLSAAEQDRIQALLTARGAVATNTSPLAWLRFETTAGADAMDLRLTLWPDGTETCLATAHPHGASVRWLG